MQCKFCGAEKIVRNGTRRTSRLHNQKYLCINCGKQFSQKHGKFSAEIILSAVCTYNGGKSLAKSAELVWKGNKTKVAPMTISRWVKKYGGSYFKIRDSLQEKYPGVEAVISKQFVHSGLIYRYTLHLHKLREFCKYDGLKKYLLSVDPWINSYFASGTRCSQIPPCAIVDLLEKKNYLLQAVDEALFACHDLKERHALVQKHLLFNDTMTLATEIPVFMYDKMRGNICGHIDALQIRDSKVFVLDYKPGAAFVDKEKTATQLYFYARALSFRSKTPLSEFRCCWFDSTNYYEFEPDKAKLRDTATGPKKC